MKLLSRVCKLFSFIYCYFEDIYVISYTVLHNIVLEITLSLSTKSIFMPLHQICFALPPTLAAAYSKLDQYPSSDAMRNLSEIIHTKYNHSGPEEAISVQHPTIDILSQLCLDVLHDLCPGSQVHQAQHLTLWVHLRKPQLVCSLYGESNCAIQHGRVLNNTPGYGHTGYNQKQALPVSRHTSQAKPWVSWSMCFCLTNLTNLEILQCQYSILPILIEYYPDLMFFFPKELVPVECHMLSKQRFAHRAYLDLASAPTQNPPLPCSNDQIDFSASYEPNHVLTFRQDTAQPVPLHANLVVGCGPLQSTSCAVNPNSRKAISYLSSANPDPDCAYHLSHSFHSTLNARNTLLNSRVTHTLFRSLSNNSRLYFYLFTAYMVLIFMRCSYTSLLQTDISRHTLAVKHLVSRGAFCLACLAATIIWSCGSSVCVRHVLRTLSHLHNYFTTRLTVYVMWITRMLTSILYVNPDAGYLASPSYRPHPSSSHRIAPISSRDNNPQNLNLIRKALQSSFSQHRCDLKW